MPRSSRARSLGSAIDNPGTSRQNARRPGKTAEPDQTAAARETNYYAASCVREAQLLEDVGRLPCSENVRSYAALAAMHRYNRAQTNSSTAQDTLNLHLLAKGGMPRSKGLASAATNSAGEDRQSVKAKSAQIPAQLNMEEDRGSGQTDGKTDGKTDGTAGAGAASAANSRRQSAISPYGIDDGEMEASSARRAQASPRKPEESGMGAGDTPPRQGSAGSPSRDAGGGQGWPQECASPGVSSPIRQMDTVDSRPSAASPNHVSLANDPANLVKAGASEAVAPVVLGACALYPCALLYASAALTGIAADDMS